MRHISLAFWARLSGRARSERTIRQRALDDAQSAIEAARRDAESAYELAISSWDQQVFLAPRILAGDPEAYDEAVSESECFDEIEESGCVIAVEWLSTDLARVSIRAQEKDVVPAEEKTVTAKGKLSSRALSASRITDIYQDFICGAALRTARELLALLPLRAVIADVQTNLLNDATGHFEEAVVLSVYCPREKLDAIAFERADPSQVVESLKHSMKFRKGRGLAATPPLDTAVAAG